MLMGMLYHCIYIHAWASALLVSTNWAMLEPQLLDELQGLPRFFVYQKNIHQINRWDRGVS